MYEKLTCLSPSVLPIGTGELKSRTGKMLDTCSEAEDSGRPSSCEPPKMEST